MMTDKENDNQISSANSNSELIQEIDQSVIGPMMTVISLKNDQPKQLIDFAGDDKSLRLIAQNLHQLLSSPGTVKFSTENKQNLEFIFQTFITDTMQKSMKKISALTHFQSDVKKLQKELFDTKNKVENLKFLLNNSEKSREELTNENKQLQNKIDSYYRNQAVSVNKMKKVKQDYENQITIIKEENNKLKEKLSQMEDDCTIKEYATQRNLEQFKNLASQTTKNNDKIEKLKEKIKKKNKQIKNLFNENQKLKLTNRKLEDDSQKTKAALNTTRADLDQMKQKDAEKAINSDKNTKANKSAEAKSQELLQSAIISISDQYEKQSDELMQLRKSHMLCTTLLHKQVEIVSEYEKQIFACEKAIKQNSSLSNELGSTKEELIQTLETLNSKVKFIRNLMTVCKVEKEEELPLYFMKLQDYGIMENRRLVAAFEDNIRFMTNLFNSSLVYDDQNIPLNEDKQFINSLQFEVSRTRQFILENTANSDSDSQNNIPLDSDSNGNNSNNSEKNSVKNSYMSNNTSNEINEEETIGNQNRTDLAILTSQILRNEILRKYSENLRHNSDAFLKIAEILGCSDNADSASKIILENESMIKLFIENAKKLIKEKANPNVENENNDNFVEEEEESNDNEIDRKRDLDEIIEFIETNNSLLDDIKKSLKFEGDSSEIPFAVEQMIRKNEILENSINRNHQNNESKESSTPQEKGNKKYTTKSIEIDDNDQDDDENHDNKENEKKNPENNSNQKTNDNNNNKNGNQKNIKKSNKNNNDENKKTKKSNKSKANNNDDDIMDEDTDQIIQEATKQLQKGNDINAEPKTDWRKRIRSCVTALKKLNNENKELKQQLNEANKHIKDIEKRSSTRAKTLTMMTDSYKGLEKYNNELLQKNRELLSEMESKSKQADVRVFKVLDQEREQHAIEIQNLQDKSNSLVERLKARVDEKKKKIIALKKKLKEVIVAYEDAFKQQKSTIAYLRNQLDKSITNSSNNEILKEVQQLNSQLKASESERQNLEMKIEQIKDENTKSQAIRDTFWKAQLVMVEQNLQAEVEKEKENILETIAAQFNCEPTLSAILNSYYLRDTDDNNLNESFPRDLTKNSKIETKVQKQLNEWEKWGRSLFTSLKNGEVFMYNSKDLRFMLSEMVMSSLSQRYLLNRLESLRIQKRFLLKMNSTSQNIEAINVDIEIDIRSLLILSIFTIRVKKNLNYLPLQQNQE